MLLGIAVSTTGIPFLHAVMRINEDEYENKVYVVIHVFATLT